MKIRHATNGDLERITELEALCFAPEEAATKDSIKDRLHAFPNNFWLMEKDGNIISMVHGLLTNETMLNDKMYHDVAYHNEDGQWQMIFSVATDPVYQGCGYATRLIQQVVNDTEDSQRRGIVLTCKKEKIKFYEKLGFINEGQSRSKHGGAVWYDMRYMYGEV